MNRSENRMRRHSARSDVRETRNRKNEWRITKMVSGYLLKQVNL